MEDLISAQMTPGDRVLWQGERAAVDGPAASPYTVGIGPIQLAEGLGIFLECSGPSDVLVSMERPDASAGDSGPLTPLLSRCLDSGQVAGGYVARRADRRTRAVLGDHGLRYRLAGGHLRPGAGAVSHCGWARHPRA